MTAFVPADYGELVPGRAGLSATGTTIDTATPLLSKVNVFTTVVSGGMALLPSSYASGTEIKVLNRTANALKVATNRDQIESYGTVVSVAPGGNAILCNFDPPLAPAPKTWWLT